jgi:threonyl-tRNA synthetase
VTAIPVAEAFADYLADVVKEFRSAGIRVELDASDDRMQKKIRNAQMQKVPYMLIAGEEDQKAGKVSIRYRNGEQKNSIAVSDAIAEIKNAIAERKQV